ncbi:MAG: hypothetical protein V7638_2741 [Acidobacteriota bacterium]|jgi:hypothetical protein
MLIRDEVEKAVRLPACGYQLLKWLEKALNDGFIIPEAAGKYATSEEAAYSWLDKHYLNLPTKARPERSELRAFSNFFSTYQDCTFDLYAEPGKRLYSPDNQCFCPICTWMVQKPHLQPKKVGSGDKKVAERMKRNFLGQLAVAHQISVTSAMLDHMLQDPNLREPIGLCTYAADLQPDYKAGPPVRRRWHFGGRSHGHQRALLKRTSS